MHFLSPSPIVGYSELTPRILWWVKSGSLETGPFCASSLVLQKFPGEVLDTLTVWQKDKARWQLGTPMSIRSLSLYPTSRGYLKIRHINNSIHTHLVTMLNSRIRNQEKKQCILYSIFKGIKTASWGIFSFLYLCLFLNLDLMPNCHYFKKTKPKPKQPKKKKSLLHFPIHCKLWSFSYQKWSSVFLFILMVWCIGKRLTA